MFRLRHAVVSLLAVLVALAVGVVWGAGPLTGHVHTRVQAHSRQLSQEQEQLAGRVAALEEEVRVRGDFVSAVARPLTAGRLAGRTVALFVLPGAEEAVVAGTAKALADAGARITATVTIRPAYVDPTNAVSPLEDLALKLVPPGVTFPAGASPIDRVSTVVARSTVTARAVEAGKVDDDAAEVVAGLHELGAVDVAGEPGVRAELAVVVSAPAGPGGRKDRDAAGRAAMRGLVRALDVAGRGAVVTGPRASAAAGGLIAELRHSKATSGGVSTVDVGDTEIGPPAVVLALAEQLRGGSRHYGTGPGATRLIAPVAPVAKR